MYIFDKWVDIDLAKQTKEFHHSRCFTNNGIKLLGYKISVFK
jgi:hypothetical protein